MKAKELRSKSEAELRKLLAETRERLRALRFNVSTSQESHVRDIRDAKKTAARILTLLKEDASSAETK